MILPINDGPMLDAIAEALPTMPVGAFDVPPPKEYIPKPEPRIIGHWCRAWESVAKRVVLTEETSPAAIAKEQRAEIRAVIQDGTTDVDAISAAVVLPVDVVERRLSEIRRHRKRRTA